MNRKFYSVLCLISIFFFSWQVGTILLLLGVIIFDFPEVVLYGFLMDIIFGLSEPLYRHLSFSIIFFILYMLTYYIKGAVRKT